MPIGAEFLRAPGGQRGFTARSGVIITAVPVVNPGERHDPDQLHVVLFSGGRGSAALARQLVASSTVRLTIVINGYDDGASTGEVRRFLGDSLGPSDFRKNASRLAAHAAHAAPPRSSSCSIRGCRTARPRTPGARRHSAAPPPATVAGRCRARCEVDARGDAVGRSACSASRSRRESSRRPAVRLRRLQPRQPRVRRRLPALRRADFNRRGRRLLRAASACRPGLIENVTDGTNAYPRRDRRRRAAARRAKRRSSTRRGGTAIREIFLIDRPLDAERDRASSPALDASDAAASVLAAASALPGDQPAARRARSRRRPDHLRARAPSTRACSRRT